VGHLQIFAAIMLMNPRCFGLGGEAIETSCNEPDADGDEHVRLRVINGTAVSADYRESFESWSEFCLMIG